MLSLIAFPSNDKVNDLKSLRHGRRTNSMQRQRKLKRETGNSSRATMDLYYLTWIFYTIRVVNQRIAALYQGVVNIEIADNQAMIYLVLISRFGKIRKREGSESTSLMAQEVVEKRPACRSPPRVSRIRRNWGCLDAAASS
ncbi:hypothetical protein [Paraburkholderia metrosideri]|uniref:hypothetical protein n=1 Tax=Paraburkholderia metrosideri TaxID=580937 RepID=UPI00191AFD5A|nr:hypothetical protein [Paraburkholderia metrosideri]